MGTNYYAFEGTMTWRHIGKSSYGWYFALRIYPDENISDLDDWIRYLSNDLISIWDEYGEPIDLKELLNIIINRNFPGRKSDNFNDINNSEDGINNLTMPSIGHGCVGYGIGPWSLHNEDFS